MIWIYGAGAVGSCLGGLLAQAGHPVTLIGREPHMTAIARDGLHIAGLWGAHHVTNHLLPRCAPPDGQVPSLVLLTVKSYDTAAAAARLEQCIGPDTVVVSLQNGVGNVERLQTVLGAARIIAGMVITGFEIPAPGHVTVTVQADVMRFGRPGQPVDATVQRVVDLLAGAGMPAAAEPEIARAQWGKVLYNSALNPLGAVLRCHYGALLARDTWPIIETIIEEAYQVLAAAAIETAWPDAPAYLAYLRDTQIPATFEHRPSMWRDLETRGRTEIDVINGAIVAAGERVGVATPVNQALCHLIRALAARARVPPTDAA